MIVMIKNDDPAFDGHSFSHIECDVEGCGERSPPTSVLLKSGGLAGLGWHVAGGHHRCPKHAEVEAPLRHKVYRDA